MNSNIALHLMCHITHFTYQTFLLEPFLYYSSRVCFQIRAKQQADFILYREQCPHCSFLRMRKYITQSETERISLSISKVSLKLSPFYFTSLTFSINPQVHFTTNARRTNFHALQWPMCTIREIEEENDQIYCNGTK